MPATLLAAIESSTGSLANLLTKKNMNISNMLAKK